MTDETKHSRGIAALSYVWLLFLIPLLTKKDDEFCQFHAKQGLVLFIVWVLVSFVAWIPLVGWAACALMLVVNIVAIVKTLNGEKWEIPYLSVYAKKIKF